MARTYFNAVTNFINNNDDKNIYLNTLNIMATPSVNNLKARKSSLRKPISNKVNKKTIKKGSVLNKVRMFNK